MKLLLLITCVGVLFANEASYNRGESIFFLKACSSCHGPMAEGSTSYPRLAHKKEEYIIKKLKDFRAGKAESVSQEMMAQFAHNLTDENIKDLAYFFAHHKKSDVKDVDDDILGGFGS